MSQYADGGIAAKKPYVSSVNYIHTMSDYCSGCYYSYHKKYAIVLVLLIVCIGNFMSGIAQN
jgi:hypothetical protein